MTQERKRIAVIGAGIAGLAAAHRIVERTGTDVDIVVLEASDRVGGVIQTEQVGELLLEMGPDSILTEKPWAVDLMRRLGLEDELIPTEDAFRRTLVVRDGKLLPLPEAFQLMAPGKITPFVTSRILSLRGRFRALLDLVLPRGGPPPGGDETLGSFVRRRFGREVLDRIAQPLVGGIYTADPEKLSLATTLPRFLELERKHRSVILGLLRQNAQTKESGTSGARYGLFVTPRRGLRVLVDELVDRLPEGSLRLATKVTAISRDTRWQIETTSGSLVADGVIVALPAPRASEILTPLDTELGNLLGKITYASTAVAALSYNRADLGIEPNFFGIVVPAREKSGIIAVSFPSVKFRGRAPEHTVMIRIFLGGALAPDLLEKNDSELLRIAREEVGRLLEVTTAPTFEKIVRWEESMPQYHAGHALEVLRTEEVASRHTGLALAGNAYHGVGLPDSIHSGEQAADSLLARGIGGAHVAQDLQARA